MRLAHNCIAGGGNFESWDERRLIFQYSCTELKIMAGQYPRVMSSILRVPSSPPPPSPPSLSLVSDL